MFKEIDRRFYKSSQTPRVGYSLGGGKSGGGACGEVWAFDWFLRHQSSRWTSAPVVASNQWDLISTVPVPGHGYFFYGLI
ncbi:hypothetical protein N7504_011078 [Penicillium tannophilum]|nr:hypothetical protein N7504_011078 [Penicillium tannophilum]